MAESFLVAELWMLLQIYFSSLEAVEYEICFRISERLCYSINYVTYHIALSSIVLRIFVAHMREINLSIATSYHNNSFFEYSLILG